MKATELRIGNWVNYTNNDSTPDFRQIEDYIEDDFEFTIRIEPIPITKEWLLKFGFITDNITYKLKFNGFRFVLFMINKSNNYNDNKNEFKADIHQSKQCVRLTTVKHVHQIQNLYFALTNTELQCTL